MKLIFPLIVIGLQTIPTKPVTTDQLPKFDKKPVKVIGKVEKYEERTAKTSKNQYTVLVLTDAKGKVNVYLHGRPTVKIKNGDKVLVTGLYQKEKKIKDRVFKNEIDASNEKVKAYGIKLQK